MRTVERGLGTDCSGWAWIFILEGLATILAACFSYWLIQDFPDTAKFLTEEERTSHTASFRLEGSDVHSTP